MDQKPLISKKIFMKGIRIILKEQMPEIFYSNQYLDNPLLLSFASQLATSIKIFFTQKDLMEKKGLLKILGESYPLGVRKIFIEEKDSYPKEIAPLLSDLAKKEILFKTKAPIPVSFMLINEAHYILKHHSREGYLVALNADKDKNLKETFDAATHAMDVIEKNAVPYSEKQVISHSKTPLAHKALNQHIKD